MFTGFMSNKRLFRACGDGEIGYLSPGLKIRRLEIG